MSGQSGGGGPKKRRCTNLYVSQRQDTCLGSLGLTWKPHQRIQKQISKFWEYMGELHCPKDTSNPDSATTKIDEKFYCKLCFERETKKEGGLLSKVYSLSSSTSTSNFFNHASAEHNLDLLHSAKEESGKMTKWLTKTVKKVPAASSYELNRDIVLWFCRDLVPFEFVEKPGFRAFNAKNLLLDLPSSRTLANTALLDVYNSLKNIVKTKLESSISGTIMADGWTDKYHRNPYLGIRFSTVSVDWKYQVFTLAVKPVASHTSECLSDFVLSILDDFLPPKKIPLFDTTDGAANMIKMSRLLGHERHTCVAHCLHNLLVTDSLSKVDDIQALISQCKEVVHTLHYKTYMLEEAALLQKEAVLFASISNLQAEISLDTENPVGGTNEFDSNDSDTDNQRTFGNSKDRTLKSNIPTRWNSTLAMAKSIINLKGEANEVLKKIGKSTLCILDEDAELLKELAQFLGPFERFTAIVSEVAPNLSSVPLIRARIKKICQSSSGDSSGLKQLKRLILQNLDKRLPMSKLVKSACCFDPSVRDVVMTREECQQFLIELHEDLLLSRYSHILKTADESSIPSTSTMDSDNDCDSIKQLRLELLDDARQLESENDSLSTFEGEVSKYLAFKHDKCALQFWKENSTNFPTLSVMARVYLGLSPGSVPVECMFSTTGLILNSKRSSVSPARVNAVSFIHDNVLFL